MNDLLAKVIAEQKQNANAVLKVGIVTAVSPLMVDINGVTPVEALNSIPNQIIEVNDALLLASTRGQLSGASTLRAISNLTKRPSQGTVLSVAAKTAVVRLGDRDHTLEWVGTTAPVVSSRVGVLWSAEGGLILGRCSGDVPTPPAPEVRPPDQPVAPARATRRKLSASAILTCTSRPGSWRTDRSRGYSPWQGTYSSYAPYTGWWFYGNKFRVGDGGPLTALGATITVRRASDEGVGVNGPITAYLRTHNYTSKPAVPPGGVLSDALEIPNLRRGEKRTVAVPVGIAQKFLDRTVAGWAVYYSGSAHYARFTGVTEDGSSGLMTIDYQEG